MTFIDDKVNALKKEEKRNFEETLRAILADGIKKGSWLQLRDFNEDYSLDMVKLTLYREMYEGDFHRLHRDGD